MYRLKVTSTEKQFIQEWVNYALLSLDFQAPNFTQVPIYSHFVQICDSNHPFINKFSRFAALSQWMSVQTGKKKVGGQAHSCKGEGKWLTEYQPRPSYSQAQIQPCCFHHSDEPTYPLSHSFYSLRTWHWKWRHKIKTHVRNSTSVVTLKFWFHDISKY